MAGLAFSTMEAVGWISWGHEALLLAIVPILGWAAAHWWVERK